MLITLMNSQLDLLKKELEELRNTNKIILDSLTPSQTALLEEKIYDHMMENNESTMKSLGVDLNELPEKLPSTRELHKDKKCCCRLLSPGKDKASSDIMDKDKLIEKLYRENTKLKGEINDNTNCGGMRTVEIEKKIQFLSTYEDKLRQLFNELLEASEVMQESRNKFCKCLKEETEHIRLSNEKTIEKLKDKNHHLESELETSRKDLSKLKSQYKKIKQKEGTMISERKALHKIIRHMSKLVKELQQTTTKETNLRNKDNERKNCDVSASSHAEDDDEDCACYPHLTNELEELVNDLSTHIDQSLVKQRLIQEQAIAMDNLRSKLFSKENELNLAHQEIQYLHKQLSKALKDNVDLARQLEVLVKEKTTLQGEIEQAMAELNGIDAAENHRSSENKSQ